MENESEKSQDEDLLIKKMLAQAMGQEPPTALEGWLSGTPRVGRLVQLASWHPANALDVEWGYGRWWGYDGWKWTDGAHMAYSPIRVYRWKGIAGDHEKALLLKLIFVGLAIDGKNLVKNLAHAVVAWAKEPP